MEKIVIVYGFDYERKIYYNHGAVLCKSIKTKLPVYACPIIIEDDDLPNIFSKILQIEKNEKVALKKLDKLAESRCEQASWKVVLYGDNLNIEVGYESEGDENGDGR